MFIEIRIFDIKLAGFKISNMEPKIKSSNFYENVALKCNFLEFKFNQSPVLSLQISLPEQSGSKYEFGSSILNGSGTHALALTC